MRSILETKKRVQFVALLSSLALVLVMGCEEPAAQADDEGYEDDDEVVEQYDDGGNDTQGEATRLEYQYEDVDLVEVAGPFEHPWAVAFLGDDRMLVTERPGRLLLVEDGELSEVTGIPEISAVNQGGLLDVVVHPDFEQNGWIYLTYSKQEDGANQTATALARARLDGDDSALTDLEDIFVQNRYSSPGRHYGSRLAWTNDGHLLMSIGDRGTEPLRAQDTSDHAGSLLRLTEDGQVPDDNPFVDDDDVVDEIYTFGNRNIQGLVVDPDSGDIWATDHGPRGGDLLHRLEGGNNYGWPIVTQGLNYRDQGPFPDFEARSMEGIEDPFYEFRPAHPPSGLALVTADQFPNWNQDLLAGGLRSQRIRRVVVHDDQILDEGEFEVLHEEELLLHEIGRIRDVRQGPDGNIWVLNDDAQASLYRIEPAD